MTTERVKIKASSGKEDLSALFSTQNNFLAVGERSVKAGELKILGFKADFGIICMT